MAQKESLIAQRANLIMPTENRITQQRGNHITQTENRITLTNKVVVPM